MANDKVCNWCGKSKTDLIKATLKGKIIFECKECKRHYTQHCLMCKSFKYCFGVGYYKGIIADCCKGG